MKTKILTTILLPLSITTFAQKVDKPNIVFFLMDDMGYGDLSFMGSQKIETPNIDALAKSGKVLTQHYAGSPVSAPTRCVLLTGQHSGHAQIRGNDEDAARGDVWSHLAMFEDARLEGQKPMDANTVTLPHLLQKSGYKTACIGKWGLGAPGSDSEPNKMGFDRFFGYNCQRLAHSYYPTHLYSDTTRVLLNNIAIQPAGKLNPNDNPLDPASYEIYAQNDYAPDLLFDQTIRFIEQNRSNPFFLWWTTPMPHVPLQAPQELIDYYVAKFGDEKPHTGGSYYPCRYPHATYAAMVTYIDRQVGQIIDKLKQEGVYENTIIVFTSDNGPTLNTGGQDSPWFDSARPFKSEPGWGKTSLHEGGIRVPTIISWAGKIKPDTKNDMTCGFQDWMPTLLEFAGAKKLIPTNADGISLRPMLTDKGKQIQHDFMYWEFPETEGLMAVRQGDWKLIVKNIKKDPTYYLFNLAQDPREQTNLVTKHPEIVAQLKALARDSHVTSSNPKFNMGLPLQ